MMPLTFPAKKLSGDCPMNLLRTTLGLLLVLAAALLAAGCTGPAGYTPENNSQDWVTSRPLSGVTKLQQNSLPVPVFPVDPVPLSGSFRPPLPLSSFEDSFIGSYECTEDAGTYSTNFTLITGLGEPQTIKYSVVPVSYYSDLTEIPLSADILSVVIEPDEFVANPSTIYTSRFSVTIGPNVTGESGKAANGVSYVRNPSYSFLVKVSANGSEVPGLNDTVNVRKWCFFHSQTRDMQASPSWNLETHDITIRAGEERAVNVSLRNFGGGIREIEFKVPGLVRGPGYTCPLNAERDQLLPVPEGMEITFTEPVMIGRNFKQDANTMIISTMSGVSSGQYHFPIILCYRDMDLADRNSLYYPFSEKLWCTSCGDFIVTVESG